jgi:Flp pilus assembly protein TadG
MGRGRRRGQALVEFALVLPLFLLVVAGAIELGRAYFSYGRLLQAAQEGARYGAELGNYRTDATIIARVRQVSPGGTSDTVTVSSTVSPTNNAAVTAANRARGNVLTVNAQHQHTVLIPFFPLSSIPMTVTASMVIA